VVFVTVVAGGDELLSSTFRNGSRVGGDGDGLQRRPGDGELSQRRGDCTRGRFYVRDTTINTGGDASRANRGNPVLSEVNTTEVMGGSPVVPSL